MNSATSPGLSIIIATRGRPRLIQRLFDSLCLPQNQTTLHEEGGEIVVVENGSPCGIRQVCHARADDLPLLYEHVSEVGKSPALNAGLAAARNELVCYFDDDVRVADGGLATYVDAAVRYGPGHFFGGPVRADREVDPPEWLEPFLPTSVMGWSLGDEEQLHNDGEFHGANWATFRDDVVSAGGFATHLGPTPRYRALEEETELQTRLMSLGSNGVYLPHATVWHHVPKEMCTKRWARKRMYQQHLTWALTGRYPVSGPSMFGAPRWLYRRCLEHAVALASRVIRRSPSSDRVAREMALARSLGRLAGHVQSRRLPPGREG